MASAYPTVKLFHRNLAIKIQSQPWLQVLLDLAHQNYAITPCYQLLLTQCFLKPLDFLTLILDTSFSLCKIGHLTVILFYANKASKHKIKLRCKYLWISTSNVFSNALLPTSVNKLLSENPKFITSILHKSLSFCKIGHFTTILFQANKGTKYKIKFDYKYFWI